MTTKLSTIGGNIKPVLATTEAAENDQTGAAVWQEQQRYERAILDFEGEIRRRRDGMHAQHLANMRAALSGEEE